MSFKTLNKDVLIQVAEEFSVDIDKRWKKDKIVEELVTMGITWEMYKTSFPDVDDLDDASPEDEEPVLESREPQVNPASGKPNVLIRMTRANPTYEVYGYRFTSDNPFLPVDRVSADYILENEEGFRTASPKEAEEFYS